MSTLNVLQPAGSTGCPASFLETESIDRMTRETSYPRESMLFVEGQPSPGIMMIVDGRVKLSTASADGRTIVVRIAGPGEVLGLSATVVGRACELTAEALQPTRVKIIPRESFKHWLRSHPELAFSIAQELAEEYNHTCQQLRSMLLSHTATQRLARTLLQLVRNAASGKQARVQLSLTHQQLGDMIGTSRETVTRALSSFRHKGIIEIEGSTLVVNDHQALHAIGRGDGQGFGF